MEQGNLSDRGRGGEGGEVVHQQDMGSWLCRRTLSIGDQGDAGAGEGVGLQDPSSVITRKEERGDLSDHSSGGEDGEVVYHD